MYLEVYFQQFIYFLWFITIKQFVNYLMLEIHYLNFQEDCENSKRSKFISRNLRANQPILRFIRQRGDDTRASTKHERPKMCWIVEDLFSPLAANVVHYSKIINPGAGYVAWWKVISLPVVEVSLARKSHGEVFLFPSESRSSSTSFKRKLRLLISYSELFRVISFLRGKKWCQYI